MSWTFLCVNEGSLYIEYSYSYVVNFNRTSHWPNSLQHLYTPVGQTFDFYSATIERIHQMKNELLRIPYSSIAYSLYDYGVIPTIQEKRVVDFLKGQSQMEYVLKIVILSLTNKQNTKFKDFLLALENNGWKNEAQRLRKSISNSLF